MTSNYKNNFISLLFIFLPISFIVGNSVINLNIVLIVIFFLFDLIKDKNNFYYENKFFFLVFLFFSTYLLFSSLISNYFDSDNVLKAFLYIRFFLFALAIKFYLDSDRINFNLISKFWLIILSIVIIDIFFEFVNGKNLLSYSSPSHGRLVSFFKDELIVGIFKNSKYSLLLLLLIGCVFLTGERSNFLKLGFIILLISVMINKNFFDKKFFFFYLFINYYFIYLFIKFF